MKRQHVWPVLAAGVLTLSACGGSDTSETAAGDDAVVEFVSPIGEFLGWDQGADFDQEAAQAEYAQQEREAQESIASCMVAEGFEYIPVDTSAQEFTFEDQFDGLEWGSDEWTATYGFGVSTQQFSQTQVGPDLVGHTWNDGGPGNDQPTDPNQAYVDSLGENERNAYYNALYGTDQGIEWDETLTDEENQAIVDDYYENEYAPTGCEPVAYEEIYSSGEDQKEFEAFDEAFGDYWTELDERMESHPEVIAYRSEVRTCVEDRGVEYLEEQEAWEFFTAELEAAGLGWEATGDPFEGLDTSDFSDEDFDRIYQEFENQTLPADKLAALAEIQAAEISVAVAISECGGGWQTEMTALGPIRVELEEEFLTANADQLAEFEGVFGD